MKAQSYRTSALFDCTTCHKRWEGLEDARKKAYQHAKSTGHIIHGEIGTAYHYDGGK